MRRCLVTGFTKSVSSASSFISKKKIVVLLLLFPFLIRWFKFSICSFWCVFRHFKTQCVLKINQTPHRRHFRHHHQKQQQQQQNLSKLIIFFFSLIRFFLKLSLYFYHMHIAHYKTPTTKKNRQRKKSKQKTNGIILHLIGFSICMLNVWFFISIAIFDCNWLETQNGDWI